MNQLDRFYRALIDYRKQTVGDYECDRLRDSIANANMQDDIVELERKICTVDNDWIDEIEKGLVFIEKAIREERQFIRSNGEVVPIEKVKRVDKESVAHLARHSNLLTKKPENENDIIPDQLYTVERLSDYAVYENRFLYMLLCYLRDFITLRYDKILELTTTYNGSLSLCKTVTHKKQKIKLEVKLVEQRKNDAYLREYNEAKEAISRIDLLLKAVIHYLSTPLMEEVGKTPMLKPPITKTNVLKMNQNFKACMALYEYVTSYTKPGYTVEDLHKKLNPLPELIADEFAEATSLISFLTYEHAMGIEGYLREEYNKEEERRKAAEAERLVEQIRALKKRIRESGMSPEEYMLLLEKRNRMLESDSAQLVIAKQEIERLNGEIEALNGKVASLEEEVQGLQDFIVALKEEHAREIAELNAKHEQEIAELNAKHEQEITALTTKYEQEIADLNEKHAKEVSELTNKYETEIKELKADYEQRIDTLQKEHESKVAELTENYTSQIAAFEKRNEEDRASFEKTMHDWQEEYNIKEEKLRAEWALDVAQWKERIREKNGEIQAANEEKEKAHDEKRLAESRMNAMRFEYGLIKDEAEFTSQASFDELEHQYHMLGKLFKQEWGKVKKDLRARMIWKLFKKGASEEEQETDGGETTSSQETESGEATPSQTTSQDMETTSSQETSQGAEENATEEKAEQTAETVPTVQENQEATDVDVDVELTDDDLASFMVETEDETEKE